METTTTRNQERSPSSYFSLSKLPAFLNWYSFSENRKTSNHLLLKVARVQPEGQKNLSLFSIYYLRLMQTEEMAKLRNKMQVWRGGRNIYSIQEGSRQKVALFVSSVSFLNPAFFHVPLQHSLGARLQQHSPNWSDSALSIYSKIRSDLERLLLENMEQSNSYSRTQNSKCTYEK